jgi:hypothetical protein
MQPENRSDTEQIIVKAFLSDKPIRFVRQYNQFWVWRSDVMASLDCWKGEGDVKMSLKAAYELCKEQQKHDNAIDLGRLILEQATRWEIDWADW